MSAIPIDFTTTFTDSAVSRGMRQIENQATATGKHMAGAFKETSEVWGKLSGLAAVGIVGAAFRGLTEHVDQIVDLSGALGLTTDEFQRLSGALAMSGVDGEKFAKGMTSLNSKIADASESAGPARESFAKLGISLAMLKVLSPEQIIIKISDALKNSGNSAEATAAAFDILGNRAARMVGALQQGGESFEAQMAKVAVASKENLDRIDALGDGFTGAKNSIMAAGETGLGTFLKYAYEAAPAISRLGGLFAEASQEVQAYRLATELLTDVKGPDLQASMPSIPGAASAFGGMPKAGKLGKIAEDDLKNAEDLLKVRQRLADMNRAFQIDELDGEEKIKALEEDHARLTEQRITAGQEEVAQLEEKIGLKELEIEKEKRLQREKDKEMVRTRITNLMEAKQSKLSGLQDDQLAFELMGNDARRQAIRDKRREDRARGRIARVEESKRERGGHDTRPGADRISKEIALNKDSITALANELAKLIPQQ